MVRVRSLRRPPSGSQTLNALVPGTYSFHPAGGWAGKGSSAARLIRARAATSNALMMVFVHIADNTSPYGPAVRHVHASQGRPLRFLHVLLNRPFSTRTNLISTFALFRSAAVLCSAAFVSLLLFLEPWCSAHRCRRPSC